MDRDASPALLGLDVWGASVWAGHCTPCQNSEGTAVTGTAQWMRPTGQPAIRVLSGAGTADVFKQVHQPGSPGGALGIRWTVFKLF